MTPPEGSRVAPDLSPDLKIEAVRDRRTRAAFHMLPLQVHADDPHYVAPLGFEQRRHLDPRTNPHFQDADCACWIVRRGDRIVGRISAQVDRLALAQANRPTGSFGHFDLHEGDAEVAKALLAQAEGWLAARGMTRITGPFEMSINDRCGLLVDGFDSPPMFMMGHARPYHGAALDAAGYTKARDLLAYHAQVGDSLPPQGVRLMARLKGRQVVVRPIDWRNYRHEIDTIMDIFNDAWAGNWGFVPFHGARLDHLAKSLKPILIKDFVAIAEVDGKPAAMMVGLLNLNEAMADLNGRLLPAGWTRLLWRLKVGRIGSMRVPLMGVRRCHQGSLMGAALMMAMFDRIRSAAYARGVRQAELSWVLEDNKPMRHVAEHMGATAYKRYRIYEKDIAGLYPPA